jgi:hypothetical protein
MLASSGLKLYPDIEEAVKEAVARSKNSSKKPVGAKV